MALYDAASDAGASPTLVFQPTKRQMDFAEDAVIHAMKSEPEIIISVSQSEDGQGPVRNGAPLRSRQEIGRSRLQLPQGGEEDSGFWSPSVTVEMFEETVPIDYAAARRQLPDSEAGL